MTASALTVLEAEETPVAAPLTLFGTQDPAAIVQRATDVATALTGVINSRGLYKRIRDRDHIFVEGWTLLGSMLGVFAEVEWSRPVDGGWEARAVARTLNGNVVGAAEAMCTKTEGTWKSRDEHAIRSMAQTRAVSKALRLPLGFIIELAGYSATPAEELNEEQAPSERATTFREAGGAKPAVTSAPASSRDRLAKAAHDHHIGAADLERMAVIVGVPANTKATDEQIEAIIQLIETGETTRPTDTAAPPVVGTTDAAQEAGDDLPPLPASEPPKPGTDEYRALEPREKAKARAYWSEGGSPQTVDAPEVAEQIAVTM